LPEKPVVYKSALFDKKIDKFPAKLQELDKTVIYRVKHEPQMQGKTP